MDANVMTQMDVVRSLRNLPLPMPANLQQLFQLIGLYDPRDGLGSLINRLDLDGVRPLQIYSTILGRAPDNIEMASVREGYSPRRHFQEVLSAPEFQKNATRNFLKLFSDKQRDIFIHIPKCAGTDLILNLAPDRLSLPKVLDLEEWVSKDDFFSSLSGLIQAAPYYDRIFVYGHIQLGEYFDIAGLRQTDRIFTVIRDPIDLLLSQANYAITRLCQDPEGISADTREVMIELGIDSLPKTMLPKELKQLAVRCLLNNRISQPNRICYYLGKGDTPSYRQAIEHIVTFDIEVTNTSNYKRWLAETWNLQSNSRHNESLKVLTLEEAAGYFSEPTQAVTSEDQKLFDVITWALEQTGEASTSGRKIAELAGADLLGDLPDRLEKKRTSGRNSMVVVQGWDMIACLEEPPSKDSTNMKAVIEADYNFSQDGNGAKIKGEGWANAEAGFTWSNARQSTIHVPCPGREGPYLLRIYCKPFVVEGLQFQNVVVLVNGEKIGSAKLEYAAVIECGLAWRDTDAFQVTLQFPDAVAPADLAHDGDDRLLGVAVTSVKLLRFSSELADDDGAARKPGVPELDELLLAFESLGENCELGLVQRRCGAEPLGLFRFSSAPLPRLLRGLKAKFKGMGRPENLEVYLSSNGQEYMVLDSRFGFRYHAWVSVGEKEPDEIALRETRRLPLLIRKLIEDLTLGGKIFVYHGMEVPALAEIQELFSAMRAFGPATLLWADLADEAHPPGTIEQIEPGLLKGYMDRFAPGENAHDLSLDCWIALCRNAYRIWKG